MSEVEMRLSNGTWKHIESELQMYHQTLKRIELRREELLHRHVPTDTNIGGGRTSMPSDPTFKKATALEGDIELQEMRRIVSAIEHVYTGLTDEKKQLIQLYYWTRPQTLTLEGVALKIHVSLSSVKRYRQEIIKSIAYLMGWR